MIIDRFAMLLLIGVVIVTIIGVIDRFILGLGLSWTEELARFLLVWTSFIAAAVAARHGYHFRVEFISKRFGRIGTQAIALFCLLTSLSVCLYGVRLAVFFNGQISPALGVPMSVVYASVPVSFAIIAFYLARDLWRGRIGGAGSGGGPGVAPPGVAIATAGAGLPGTEGVESARERRP